MIARLAEWRRRRRVAAIHRRRARTGSYVSPALAEARIASHHRRRGKRL